jgi:hypothetical protein
MPVERDAREMPSAPLPAWIRVRINTITSEKELRRLLRTEYIGEMAHPAWRKWAAPRLVAERKPLKAPIPFVHREARR